MEVDFAISDHKLCGFLSTVLTPSNPQSKTLEFGTLLEIFSDGPNVGFKSHSGVILLPIPDKSAAKKTTPLKKKRAKNAKKIGIGIGHGNSVVHQVKTLVNQKCLKIVSRVVGVAIREDSGEIRVVVLVDVYLPIALWDGWQFPRSGTTAAALFRHLSCDWRERTSILREGYYEDVVGDCKRLWNFADCHILGCKQHSAVSDSPKKKGFELHDIFKSLPSLTREVTTVSSRITPDDLASSTSGIWDITDDIVVNILSALQPIDLVRVSATCRHLRCLAASVMPCIKLKLFPHQQAAVEWMVQRERNVTTLDHPLYLDLLTEDGFAFHINIVSGELVTGPAPTISDFRGGMFCDEPGLGKTITALSLILKTQGTLADAPGGAQVLWCGHSGDQKCGYYECSGSRISGLAIPSSLGKRCIAQTDRRSQFSPNELIPKDYPTPKKARLSSPNESSMYTCPGRIAVASPDLSCSTPTTHVVRFTRSLNRVKKNLLNRYEGTSKDTKAGIYSGKRKHASSNVSSVVLEKQLGTSDAYPFANKMQGKDYEDHCFLYNETWVQCDACQKWRRLSDDSLSDSRAAWFCSLNSDPLYQSCNAPEESSDDGQPITYLPGFCSKENSGGLPQNIAFFTSVLKEHYALLNCQTKKALTWLARLTPHKLSDLETVGLIRPGQINTREANGFHKIFQAFGLVKRVKQGISRWFYPKKIDNLVFDMPALRIALCEPLDSFRMYLSRATLIVVPSNLVDHWEAQIQKHVRPGQLRVYVWNDHKKPSAHNLAWDFDVVITTFSRLSAEWNPRKRSALMQVHWLRVMLDEGHTLGSSINLTNKMQIAVSLSASSRWILTGTPTPNTPNSQVAHLQSILKFLHDEAYGENNKNWEAGILKPFEAEMEEGRLRLLQLLKSCMISARKADLRCIPPCVKKTTYINFAQQHAKTYNELVVTVRRNILLADWNDPSHVESLLNPKQWKFRTTTIRNVRLSCCVAGHIKVTDAGQDIQETMDTLEKDGLDRLSEEYALIKYYLSYGGNCQRCQEWCRLPIVTPCRHLLCLDCVALDSEKCAFPGCGSAYKMQSPETLARPENPNPKWPVPQDLIELQPSYKQDNWDPDWQSTSSSKVAYLVKRLKGIQAASGQLDCSMDNAEYLVKAYDLVPHPEPYIKPSGSCEMSAEKVLIFSQFLEHIHVIEQQLSFAGIKYAGMHSPMNASSKKKSLAVFQHDPNCMALVMDGSAALGLDLSFVTYVFLMEPIWDRSLEEQVISRAHRMGASRPIHVETLAMRGTIEEQMLEFLQNTDECKRLLKEDHDKTEHEGGRAHRSLHDFAERNYLVRLSMVRTKA